MPARKKKTPIKSNDGQLVKDMFADLNKSGYFGGPVSNVRFNLNSAGVPRDAKEIHVLLEFNGMLFQQVLRQN